MDYLYPTIFGIEAITRLLVACYVLIRKGNRPAVATAWVLFLLLMPAGSLLAFAMFGEPRLGWMRRKRHAEVLAALDIEAHHGHRDPDAIEIKMDQLDRAVCQIATSASHSKATRGNALDICGDTDSAIARMVADIDSASAHVHLLTYIFLDDESGRAVADALIAAAKRGVKVRVLCDDVGSRRFLRGKLCHTMMAAGVRVTRALPVGLWRIIFTRLDLRNHRKLLIVDGRIAHVGSMNIASASFAPDPKFAPWVDCMVRAEGPVVREVQLVFLEDWYFETGEDLRELMNLHPPLCATGEGAAAQFVASGPNFDNESTTQLVQGMLRVARQEVVLTTPYFVPNIETVMAMCVAAKSGVSVTLVIPKRNNSRLVALASRAYYEVLLSSNVKIFEFEKGLLHAKTVTVDRQLSLVTSANLDRRSFDLNFEASLVVYDNPFAHALRKLQAGYIASSTQLSGAAWRRRPLAKRLIENAAGLLSPLL